MKNWTIALTSALAASALTTGLHWVLFQPQLASAAPVGRDAGPAPAASSSAPVAPLAAPASRLEDSALLARIAELESSLAKVNEQVEQIAPTRVAHSTEGPQVLDVQTAMRGVAQQVLTEDKAKAEADRIAKEQELELQRSKMRAAQIAKELGLTGADEEALSSVLFNESQKRSELMSKYGAQNGNLRDLMLLDESTRDQFRDDMRGLRDWRDAELSSRLGASVADQIKEADGMRWGRGGDMGPAFGALGYAGGGGRRRNGPGGNGGNGGTGGKGGGQGAAGGGPQGGSKGG